MQINLLRYFFQADFLIKMFLYVILGLLYQQVGSGEHFGFIDTVYMGNLTISGVNFETVIQGFQCLRVGNAQVLRVIVNPAYADPDAGRDILPGQDFRHFFGESGGCFYNVNTRFGY